MQDEAAIRIVLFNLHPLILLRCADKELMRKLIKTLSSRALT
jgi:hypothetical protein